jgi:hypothetical protein
VGASWKWRHLARLVGVDLVLTRARDWSKLGRYEIDPYEWFRPKIVSTPDWLEQAALRLGAETALPEHVEVEVRPQPRAGG